MQKQNDTGYAEIEITKIGTSSFAYLVDYNINQVLVCQFDETNATIGTCANADTIGAGVKPAWIRFHIFNGTQYAYIPDNNNGGFYQCSLNNDGTFASCNNIIASFNPILYAFYQFSFVYTGTQWLAYIPGFLNQPMELPCVPMNSSGGAYGSSYCALYDGSSLFQQINSMGSSPLE